MLDLKGMLLGPMSNLRHVIRFGTCFRLHQESVAEHSFFTAFYAMMVAKAMEMPSDAVGRIVRKALLHDMEEAITNDFPRPFKYSGDGIREALTKASHIAAFDMARSLIPGNDARSSAERSLLFQDWHGAKEGEEGVVLEFADFLSALSYVANEVRNGNTAIKPYCVDMKAHKTRFDNPKYKAIPKSMIDEMHNIAAEVFRE